ncbi:MAG: transposase [Thermoplasmata archaeon]|nr:transposase [Thermoplasmata archaeon]
MYKITASRSHEVPLEVLGKKSKGVDIHDRHSAYKALAKKTKRPQQDCWAHLICNAKELAQFYGTDGKRIHETLKRTYKQALKFDHQGTDEDIDKLYKDMKTELIKKPYKSTKCWKFVENLLKEKNSLFQFVKNPEVEATNNRAERGLRHSVIARKISGGNKTPKGAQIYETLTSVYHTLKLRKQSLLTDGQIIIQTSHG